MPTGDELWKLWDVSLRGLGLYSSCGFCTMISMTSTLGLFVDEDISLDASGRETYFGHVLCKIPSLWHDGRLPKQLLSSAAHLASGKSLALTDNAPLPSLPSWVLNVMASYGTVW